MLHCVKSKKKKKTSLTCGTLGVCVNFSCVKVLNLIHFLHNAVEMSVLLLR